MTPGVYRRRIRIAAEDGAVRADLEDDPHRLGVRIGHDGRHVTAAAGTTHRTPWSLCPDSAGRLERLVGMALAPTPLAVHGHTPGQQQCTHMFDLAGLAIAHAARGVPARQYDAAVTVASAEAPRQARLQRDGREVLWWTVDGTTIIAPAPFAGRDLRSLLAWAETACDGADAFEAVVVLRRAVHISSARLMDLDDIPSAASLDRYGGACFVFQPERAAGSSRNRGSTRDFTHAPDALLRDAPTAG